MVVIHGHSLFAAAELLALLLLGRFRPLVVFDIADQSDGRLADAELAVVEHLLGVGIAGHMDDLAGEGGAEVIGTAHDLRLGLRFVQGVAGSHEITFVPPEQSRTGHEQGNAHTDTGERIAEP